MNLALRYKILVCMFGLFAVSALAADAEQELEELLTEVELDQVDVIDVEPNADGRGQDYVRGANRLEAEIVADRELRKKKRRVLRFRVPVTDSLQDFNVQIGEKKSIGVGVVRAQSRVGVRRRQREYREEQAARRKPIPVKEFMDIESEVILRSMRKSRYFISNFDVERPRNLSGSVLTSSATEPYSDEVESEVTRIMWSVFRSGVHATQEHPGANIRRSTANE